MKVLSVQSNIYWENPNKNFSNVSKLLDPFESCDLIVLPEMFNTGFSMESSKISETKLGKSINWLKELAKNKQATVISSLAIEENNKYYNRLYCVSPTGGLKHYNKRHLFRMAGENQYYEPGTENITIKVKEFRIRPMICYDLRFPVWSRNINNADYDCLIYIANWPAKRTLAWNSLLRARAIENQAYVIGVNRVGIDGNEVRYSGDSRVFDFSGERMDEFQTNQIQVQVTDLNINQLTNYRKNFPCGMDADLFKIL